ncbi:MAG: hypothetical protein GX080_02570 [Tissierellia bacterium]|nr:hypothetical protein [Tissierellia bacterium]
MENTSNVKEKKTSKFKIVIVVIVVLVFLAGMTFAYFKIPSLNSKINSLIGRLPWISSRGNQSSLPEGVTSEKLDDLADYYLSIDMEEAADKLYLIKKDDEMLYSSLIRLMNKKSATKTGELIKLVRNLEGRDDLLVALHDELTKEKQSKLNEEVSKLEGQDLSITLRQIEVLLSSDNKHREELADIFNKMDENILANIMYYLDEEFQEQIYSLLPESKRSNLESQVLSVSSKKLQLKDLASLYESKPIAAAIKEIGNTELYSLEELGVIYSNMSILKSAEILSNIKDDDFIKDVLASIRREDSLNNQESTANKITEAIEFLKEYNQKINELAKVYEQMSPDKVALITEKMINNNNTVTALQWDSEPVFEVTDAVIITDVLSKLKDKTISRIINSMSTDNAHKLTQMLAKP